ncbi:MAG TPA: 50S ribosomal protein L10 [Chloroflexi bacterium]|nr:50S ribosomal protein L10 [Chloroflexota bacterium]
MAIAKQRKDELLREYTEQIEQSHGMILMDYRGLGVGQMGNIRHTVRPVGGKFQVVKNRLMKLALEEAGISLPEEWLVGPTAIGFCFDEVPPMAKVLSRVSKDVDALKFKGGLVGTSVITADQVHVIADLPSKEVLFSQVLGNINAPASQIVGVIASGIRQVLNVLQAHVDKLQEAGDASASPLEQAAEPA